MKILHALLTAALLAAPLHAAPKGERGGSKVIPGIYAGYTLDSYLEFEVKEDGSVEGWLEHTEFFWWPDSYLIEHFLWGAVSGQLSGRNGTLELEWHYDFPDEDAYYLDEDQYETLSVRAGKDVDGTPTLVANQGWGIKFEFALQP